MNNIPVILAQANPCAPDGLGKYLESTSYQVHVCRDGQEVSQRLDELGTAVVLLDLDAPGMGGIELAARIRADHPRGAVYMIVLTGNSDEQHCSAVLESDIDDYLSKPVRPC